MIFKTLQGGNKNVNVSKYVIDWLAPCRSQIQFDVKQFFSKYWEKEVVLEELLLAGTKYRVDLTNLKRRLFVETNGPQHDEVHYWHGKTQEGFMKQLQRDRNKRDFAALNNFQLIEILPEDLPLLSLEYMEEKFGISII